MFCIIFLIEFGIPVKQARVIKICLNETYSNVWTSNSLFGTFPVKNGLKHVDALLLLIFNFAVAYAIMWVQAGQDGMKLNGTRQLVVYVDVNLLGESIYAMKKNINFVGC